MSETLANFQEDRLRDDAVQRRSFADLIFFYAVQRNFTRLSALEHELESDGDRLIFDLLQGVDPVRLVERAGSGSGPWVHYTLAKALLRKQRFDETLQVIEASLSKGVPGTSVLNLTARCMARAGLRAQACGLTEISLELAPQQRDIKALQDAIHAGMELHGDLYLSPLPKRRSVSFYLPVYNVEAYIREAIEGLLAQSYPLDAICVIDDGTTDRAMDIAAAYPVTPLAHGENRGLAAARNTAFHHLASPFVGAIDADAVPDPRYTQHIMMELENGAPDVAGVGGRLHERYGDTPADRWRAAHLCQDQGAVRIHPPEFLFGSNTIYHRQRVLEVGGFDERYRSNWEDVDLSKRLLAAGYTFTFTPHAQAYHLRRDTPASVLRTLWNWAAVKREQSGALDSPNAVLEEMPNTLQRSINLINHDMETERSSIAYVDLLYFFHETFLNLDYCVRHGMLEPGPVRHLQNRLLDSIQSLDRRHGGKLYAKVLSDSAALLMDGVEPLNLKAEHALVLERSLAELERVYAAVSPELYGILIQ